MLERTPPRSRLIAGPAGVVSRPIGVAGKGGRQRLVELLVVTRHSRLGGRAVPMQTACGPPAQPLCYSSSWASTVTVAPLGGAENIRFKGSV